MALTRDFRETVQARVRGDEEFRRGLLRDAIEALLAGEAPLGREILRDFINATVGFPTLAEQTGIHAKTLHQMFGPRGNPTSHQSLQDHRLSSGARGGSATGGGVGLFPICLEAGFGAPPLTPVPENCTVQCNEVEG